MGVDGLATLVVLIGIGPLPPLTASHLLAPLALYLLDCLGTGDIGVLTVALPSGASGAGVMGSAPHWAYPAVPGGSVVPSNRRT